VCEHAPDMLVPKVSAFGVQLGHHRLGLEFRKRNEALRRLPQQLHSNRRIVSCVPAECHCRDGAIALADTGVLHLIGRLYIEPLWRRNLWLVVSEQCGISRPQSGCVFFKTS